MLKCVFNDNVKALEKSTNEIDISAGRVIKVDFAAELHRDIALLTFSCRLELVFFAKEFVRYLILIRS